MITFWIGIVPGLLGQATIKGKVFDVQTGEALTGANVYLKSALLSGTFTDTRGCFSLPVTGIDTMYISFIGYQNVALLVDAASVKDTRIIDMHPDAQLIQAVEVKAPKLISEEFATQRLNKLDIYLNPNAKADALLAIQALPASTTLDETANISLRGSPAFETGIFLNNVPVREAVRLDQVNGVGRFSIFNTAMLESVNVFPSNPPLEFGGSTSGVVALYTDSDLPPEMTSISFNLAGGGLYLSRPMNEKSGITLFSNFNSHHGLRGLNPNALESLEALTSIDGGVYFVHHFSSKTRLKIYNYSLFERYRFQFNHASYAGIFRQKKNRNLIIANLSHQWGNNILEFNQSYNRSHARYAAGNFQFNLDNQDHFTSLNYRRYGDEWSWKSGISVEKLDEHFSARLPVYGHALGLEHPSYPMDTLQTLWIPELYTYFKYQWSEKIVTGGGLRYFTGNADFESFLGAQFNADFNLSEYHSVIASLGRYYKIGLANRNTAGEAERVQSTHYTIDYKYKRKEWEVNAALYHKMTRRNALDNPIWGAELALNYQSNNFSGHISCSRVHSSLRDDQVSWPSNYDLDYFLRIIVKYNIPSLFEIGLIYLRRPGQYYTPVIDSRYHRLSDTYIPIYVGNNERERLSEYQLLDMNITKMFPLGNGSMVAFLNCSNVLDFKNVGRYTYSEDYMEKRPEWLGRRVFFLGGVWSF